MKGGVSGETAQEAGGHRRRRLPPWARRRAATRQAMGDAGVELSLADVGRQR